MHTPPTGVTTHRVFKIHKSHFVCVQKWPLLLLMNIQLASKNKCYQATPPLLFINNINSIQTGNLGYFVQLIMDRDCDRPLFPFFVSFSHGRALQTADRYQEATTSQFMPSSATPANKSVQLRCSWRDLTTFLENH